jgi:hypothetical protein
MSFALSSASFSFNQVHRAVLKDGSDAVMKIQYPGVADSIESDLENVRLLLTYTNLIPKGLFLDRAMKVNLFFITLIEIGIIHSVSFLSYFCLQFCTLLLDLFSVKIVFVLQT